MYVIGQHEGCATPQLCFTASQMLEMQAGIYRGAAVGTKRKF
jgi:hypothetical protein